MKKYFLIQYHIQLIFFNFFVLMVIINDLWIWMLTSISHSNFYLLHSVFIYYLFWPFSNTKSTYLLEEFTHWLPYCISQGVSDWQNVFQFLQQVSNLVTKWPKSTSRGGQPRKKWISKTLGIICCALNLCLKTLSILQNNYLNPITQLRENV